MCPLAAAISRTIFVKPLDFLSALLLDE